MLAQVHHPRTTKTLRRLLILDECKRTWFFAFAFFLASSAVGCSTNRTIPITVPTTYLNTEPIPHPVFDGNVTVSPLANDAIHVQWQLEEAIQAALSTTLRKAELFRRSSTGTHVLEFQVLNWTQPGADFAMFASSLTVNYVLRDESGEILAREEIVTDAASDRWFFQGVSRAKRSAAVNVAKNVNEFVDTLRRSSEPGNTAPAMSDRSASSEPLPSTSSDESIHLLRELHMLHREGMISEDEYERKKSEIMDRL